MSCKVGNQTNSQDPQAVNSRVFVGNLNTFQCSKTDVERMFQRYGRIAGISMHKGYAFIQFTNPFDARSACLGEDGRLLWGQTLDVNMVAEPKAHQTGRKRQNIAKTGNDWDYYYDSYYAQVGFPTPRLVPPMKRARLHVPPTATPRPVAKPSSPNKPYPANNTSLADLKSYSTPDILICGNCREMFSEIDQLMEHKKTYCKLRFTCKCHMLNGCKPKTPGEEPASLLCSQCKDSFHSAWDLMVHVQAAHMLNIYQLSSTENTVVVNTNCNSISTTTNTIRDLHENKLLLLDENGGGGGEGGVVSMSTSTMVGGGMMGNGDAGILEDCPSSSALSLLHNPHHHSQLSQQQQQQQQQQHNNYAQSHLHSNNNNLNSSHPHPLMQQQQQQHQNQQQQQPNFCATSTSSSTSISSSTQMTSTSIGIGLDGHSPCGHIHHQQQQQQHHHHQQQQQQPQQHQQQQQQQQQGGLENCSNLNHEIPMETTTTIAITPERQIMNGGIGIGGGGGCSNTSAPNAAASASTAAISAAPASTTTTTTSSSTTPPAPAAFPMEASTQTQTLHSDTDSPSNFDEHCGLLSAMKAEGMTMSSSKHVPFTNGQPVGV